MEMTLQRESDDEKDESDRWEWDGQTTRSTDIPISATLVKPLPATSFLQAAMLPRQPLVKATHKDCSVSRNQDPAPTPKPISPPPEEPTDDDVLNRLRIEKSDAEAELVTYKEQCDRLINLLGPHEHSLWEAEQQISKLEKDMQKLIIDKSVFQEQCQQLSEALVSATRKQNGFMDHEYEIGPLKAELSQVRNRISEQQQQLSQNNATITSLTAKLSTHEQLLEENSSLQQSLQQHQQSLAQYRNDLTHSFCRDVVKEIVSNAICLISHIETRSLTVSNAGLHKELKASVRESELLRLEVVTIDKRIHEIEAEKKIVIKKKDEFIKQLQQLVRSGQTEQAGEKECDSVIHHDNRILSERVAAAEDLNAALQKMLVQQESLIATVTTDNDIKTSIIEQFALGDTSSYRQAISLPVTPASSSSSGGFFRNKKPTDDKRTLSKALEESLSANCRLRENVKHLDEEIIRLRSMLQR
eukprot:TRINITY_DN20269_c0_g1_i1.p1 TRINITY_DN20269_c0_g1~~TRINITY_DN20269_c0_g1_i1.p1  ORF type:complete len:472 (+),score=119.17 TRINITY_DN20269_c0_g1_i1:57-1472(+)